MIDRQRITVVLPLYNEARHIAETLGGIPHFVDDIVVVDDGSSDGSAQVLRALLNPRLHVVTHTRRRGVGGALATGFRSAIQRGSNIIATMDADGQMAPMDLPRVIEPITSGRATYVKGNRFAQQISRRDMPMLRRIVNRLSSAFFRRILLAPALRDVHCGYTAMTAATARILVAQGFHDSYGVYNDILAKVLAMPKSRVEYVPVAAIYGDERSHIRFRDLLRMSVLCARIALGEGRRALKTSAGFVRSNALRTAPPAAHQDSQRAA